MPSLSLRKPKALDASGQPIDAGALYQSISAHARGNRVFNPGHVLRGNDPDLLAAPQLWVSTTATTPEKNAAIAKHVASKRADVPEPPPDPTATKIAGLIPPEFRVRATQGYHDATGRMFRPGDLADARDPFVAANASMFAPEHDSAA